MFTSSRKPDSEISSLEAWDHPLLRAMSAKQEITWINHHKKSAPEAVALSEFTEGDVREAEARLARFAPFLAEVFPETVPMSGIIESAVRPLPNMEQALGRLWGARVDPVKGLLIKLDSHLPVAGSIKARGGFHEVLALAERLARDNGMLNGTENYQCLNTPRFRHFFHSYRLAVGSTGNLGLSVGLMGSALGFETTVHMSSDAKAWKKDLLRSKGVEVREYEGDYGLAVKAGRNAAMSDTRCHFVDDERSRELFLGYAVAGLRLEKQLRDLGVEVNERKPLAVYLPCGVGGGPAGVCFGLKLAFGDAVRCYFVEPAAAPAVALGMITGLGEAVDARDIGLDGKTALDGLAVSRPSGLVCRAMKHLLDGLCTTADEPMFALLRLLAESEGIKLEPSALAGFAGLFHDAVGSFARHEHVPSFTRLVWATGGSLVPSEEWNAYAERG